MSGYKRLTINVADDLHAMLQANADERDITLTELIKRAVALDQFVWQHRDGELLIRDGEDVLRVDQNPRPNTVMFTATIAGSRHQHDVLTSLTVSPDGAPVVPHDVLWSKRVVVHLVGEEPEEPPL